MWRVARETGVCTQLQLQRGARQRYTLQRAHCVICRAMYGMSCGMCCVPCAVHPSAELN